MSGYCTISLDTATKGIEQTFIFPAELESAKINSFWINIIFVVLASVLMKRAPSDGGIPASQMSDWVKYQV